MEKTAHTEAMNDFSPETPESRISVSPELGNKIAEAKASIEAQRDMPASEVATNTEQMGLLASLGGLYKDMLKKKLGIAFKDVKAALAIIPFAPLASEAIAVAKGGAKLESVAMKVNKAAYAESAAVKAQKAANKAERWARWFGKSEKAQQKLGAAKEALSAATTEANAATQAAKKALERGLKNGVPAEGVASRFVRKHIVHDIRDADYVLNYEKAIKSGKALTDAEKILSTATGEVAAKTFGEKAVHKAKTIGKHTLLHSLGPIIDPTPNVPHVVVLGSFGAELFGQVWAGLIPPVWQYLHNRYEDVKVGWDTAVKAKDIVTKHFSQKVDTLKDPTVAKAAEVFVPHTTASSA
jgi:hypothetical protein